MRHFDDIIVPVYCQQFFNLFKTLFNIFIAFSSNM
nr:MAG TPA: hypothetical protein [Caudoviricetes sp.]